MAHRVGPEDLEYLAAAMSGLPAFSSHRTRGLVGAHVSLEGQTYPAWLEHV